MSAIDFIHADLDHHIDFLETIGISITDPRGEPETTGTRTVVGLIVAHDDIFEIVPHHRGAGGVTGLTCIPRGALTGGAEIDHAER